MVWHALESGRWVNESLRPAAVTRQDQKFEALIRLHGKAVMTAREVFVLLRSGFSTGALARWRTLHEVWVIFLLLADGDEELSRRYLVHEVVESLKGQKEYEQTWQPLGLEPPEWTAAEREKAWQGLAVDLTSIDVAEAGAATVRVLAPGLQPNAPAAYQYLGTDRLHTRRRELWPTDPPPPILAPPPHN